MQLTISSSSQGVALDARERGACRGSGLIRLLNERHARARITGASCTTFPVEAAAHACFRSIFGDLPVHLLRTRRPPTY